MGHIEDVITPEAAIELLCSRGHGRAARMQEMRDRGLWWIEEPTSPDDVLGHAAIARAVAPLGVATGEHAHNRVMFKQLMQRRAISFCQIDACRLAGVNEVIAVLLMAAALDAAFPRAQPGSRICVAEAPFLKSPVEAVENAAGAPQRIRPSTNGTSSTFSCAIGP